MSIREQTRTPFAGLPCQEAEEALRLGLDGQCGARPELVELRPRLRTATHCNQCETI